MRLKISRFFDKFEDSIRFYLSRHPIIYALIAGTAIVLFWRSVWEIADYFSVSPWYSLGLSILLMLSTGTFISFFIGEGIIISGLKEEKRIDQKTEKEIAKEEADIKKISLELKKISKQIKLLEEKIDKSAE